ncbi:hypothetical protein PAP18089_01385 [Pandoraea apista]|uniref:Uncharacterized protein n=1 Tax=Pandoraea apista TaxID=93218 RepID=A0A5E5P2C8_9BURK|nr:hypothetical protein PAP18089_01385 [Pandoraea apista]
MLVQVSRWYRGFQSPRMAQRWSRTRRAGPPDTSAFSLGHLDSPDQWPTDQGRAGLAVMDGVQACRTEHPDRSTVLPGRELGRVRSDARGVGSRF